MPGRRGQGADDEQGKYRTENVNIMIVLNLQPRDDLVVGENHSGKRQRPDRQ